MDWKLKIEINWIEMELLKMNMFWLVGFTCYMCNEFDIVAKGCGG